MFDQITEFESAVMTAENCGDAYRALDLPTMPNGQTLCRALILAEIKRHHPKLSVADRLAIKTQVIAQWIADYNS
jgi:hypothetical protein